MTTINRIKSAALLCIVAGISIFTIGCSEDSPNGPSNTAPVMDDITVSLSRIDVAYDCDNNVTLGSAAGDFEYAFAVYVLNETGNWEIVRSFPVKDIALNNGETGEISGRSVTFSLPREDGRQFRVWTMVREFDGGNNYDFISENFTIHEFKTGQSQDWKPTDKNYSSYSSTTQQGYVEREIHIRDQKKTLGIVTTEGCRLSVRYNVLINTRG